MSDEGFREIQLNGKQLVFLFMAATVVSVVIFLCGVLVGRGVRPTSVAEMATTNVAPDRAALGQPESSPPLSSTPSVQPPAAGAATPPAEELSYAERLLREDSPQEHLKKAPAVGSTPRPSPAPVQEPVAKPAPAAAAPTPPPAATPPASAAPTPAPTPAPAEAKPPERPAPAVSADPAAVSDPSGPGYAVQVAAYRDRREADTLAKQLIAKGYPAFVMDPVKGAPTAMFRVRVGKYKTLKDAEAVSARLQSAERFKPWIAR